MNWVHVASNSAPDEAAWDDSHCLEHRHRCVPRVTRRSTLQSEPVHRACVRPGVLRTAETSAYARRRWRASAREPIPPYAELLNTMPLDSWRRPCQTGRHATAAGFEEPQFRPGAPR